MMEFGGFIECFIIILAALILLGPKELPTVLRAWGRILFKYRQMTAGFKRYMHHYMDEGQLDAFEKEAHKTSKKHDLS
tara:strand:+ start:205 stop:438 length:234 start_codon:yes stop_codon:yes gene_type:complete